MKKAKMVLHLALAAALVWALWYGVFSTISIVSVRWLATSSQSPPHLLPSTYRPVLDVSGVWHIARIPQTDAKLLNNSSVSAEPLAPRIPRILHQTFRTELVYGNYLPMINSCLAVNPGWTYYLWRDSDADAFISEHYPKFLAKYRSYGDNLERADSIRYMVLHHFGGIYLDMDVECRQPFFPALSQLPAFVDQERTEQSNIFWSMPFSAMNSVMGSRPGHPFFLGMIEAMSSHGRTGNAFDTTGPRLLTAKLQEYARLGAAPPVALMEPRVFSPLMDGGKNWKNLCKSTMSRRAASGSVAASGCRTLARKRWSMDDTDEATLAVHRFLHLGYGFAAASRKLAANLTTVFPGRVALYHQPMPPRGRVAPGNNSE